MDKRLWILLDVIQEACDKTVMTTDTHRLHMQMAFLPNGIRPVCITKQIFLLLMPHTSVPMPKAIPLLQRTNLIILPEAPMILMNSNRVS